MEKDTVKLQMPIYTYDTASIQEYLTQKAREGLFVTKFAGKVCFKKDTPKNLEYLLLPLAIRGYEISETERGWYRERGYEFVCTYMSEYGLFIKQEETVTDKVITIQDKMVRYGELKKRMIKSMIYPLISTLILVLSILLQVNMNQISVYLVHFELFLALFILLLNYLISTVIQIRDILYVNRLSKMPEPKIREVKYTRKWSGAKLGDNVYLLLVLAAAVITIFCSVTKQYYKEVPYQGELADTLPFTLSQIEDESTNQWYFPKDSLNEKVINKGFFGSLITITESAYYLEQKTGTRINCSLETKILQTKIPGMNGLLMDAMIHDMKRRYRSDHFTEEKVTVTIDGATESILLDSDLVKILVVQRKDSVYAFVYQGREEFPFGGVQ